MWTRRRTDLPFPGQTPPDDWVVIRRGQIVGRIMEAVSRPGAAPWQWTTWTMPHDRGTADSRDDALHQLREALRRRWPDDVPELPLAAPRRPRA